MKAMPRGVYLSDEALIAGIGRDDEAALKYLYKLYFPMVLNFIQNNNGTEDEAKDVYQDAVIIFYEKIKDGSLTLSCQIKTYLYSVCRRLWLKRLGEKSRHSVRPRDEEFFLELEDEKIPDPEKENRFLLMDESLLLLGEPCKTLLEDFYVNDLSMEQITEKFKYTNADNAKNQKYKCLLRLKKLFFTVYKPEE
jgi:RNA polymerase sigma factor (sigma-70 family)